MNFTQSLDYLLSLGFERSVKKFGLENTTLLLDALGNPQNKFLKVQIAGTNGKGSTCAFLEAICVSAGVPVGVNTSPHLVSVTERVRVNGEQISEEDFARYATKVREAGEKLVADGRLPAMPTFFEHVTVIAQLVFQDRGVRIAILEVGLGGRFDATTATKPEIVGITPIAIDHVKTLGPTLKDIAGEKAATIRHDTRLVSVPQTPVVEGVIRETCMEKGVEAIWAEPGAETDEAGVVHFQIGDTVYDASLSMPGRHQWTNAALAIYLAQNLRDWGFGIQERHIEKGLEAALHPGRLEYSDGILFDGAHNEEGVKALAEYLANAVSEPITMIYGTSGGKDLEAIAATLFPLADNLVLTTAENPRALDASEFSDVAKKHASSLHVVGGVGKAVELGRELARDGLLLVTGSLYLVGEVKAYLNDRDVERRKKKNPR